MVSGFVINGGENCHESRQPTLIPKETVQQLCALLVLHKQDELTGIAKDEQHLFFAQDKRMLVSRALAGQFPNYESIAPQNDRALGALSTWHPPRTRGARGVDPRWNRPQIDRRRGKSRRGPKGPRSRCSRSLLALHSRALPKPEATEKPESRNRPGS